ncbi:hypothetical protein TWF696_000625 [Orbilia brochopaga]|uniref:Mannosyl-oligosaccharide glucosidase n=1 Tax=Orbilia brochopaga TaxID=3140254 RepID=A0AAV9VCA8_9PEZI
MVVHGDYEFLTEEEKRLKADRDHTKYWKKWGPYVSERQWATVREDYSADGDAWSNFPHEHARLRAYRWGEDGIAGVCDNHGILNIAFSFWNEKDPFLKERLYGLSNPQGNHGESIKEAHFHLDNTPSHSYMKFLYKYPQGQFPYEKLVDENRKRDRNMPEYTIFDAGAFDDNRYWDIFIETAKDGEDEEELLFRITAYNRGPEPAPLHIVPQMWFRNTWSWGREPPEHKPIIRKQSDTIAQADHHKLGSRYMQLSPSPGVSADAGDVSPELIFTENDTNLQTLYNVPNNTPYVKDGFHRYIVNQQRDAVNPQHFGTKTAAWYAFDEADGVPPGGCAVVRMKFSRQVEKGAIDEELFDEIMESRRAEADEFYWRLSPLPMADDLRNIQRMAWSGMLWTKQWYHFVWDHWANGDPAQPPPPPGRKGIRNASWKHIYCDDVLSMPEAWEYPFFAAWDSAFHCIPLAMIDPDFAKKQLDTLTREWYMHPNGQLAAYEWNFSDVNPPVHAWATFRTFKIERKMYGREDLDFLERVFQKLLLNFTWWANRKDPDGKNLFEGGFLGLDNIGLFNRSEPLPTGGVLEQADSTGWMAFYCLNMLNISLELAKHRPAYEDIASKFFEHFILISDALSAGRGGEEQGLWNDEDGFYYDAISWGGPYAQQLPVRSLVGLIPLYACLTLEPEVLKTLPSFRKRFQWFLDNKADVADRNLIHSVKHRGKGKRILLSLVNRDRLVALLKRMLDENEFFSDFGIRSLSKHHKDHPYSMWVGGQEFHVDYVPGDSNSGMFGGNSNWRGPIWLATNFLLVESLLRFYMYYGDSLKVECPTGSGEYYHLGHVAEEIQHRMQHIFTRDEKGNRACNGSNKLMNQDPHWKDCLFFHEFFHADTGVGLGAAHQTGWTGLIAKIIHDTGINCRLPNTPRPPQATASQYFDDTFPLVSRPKMPNVRRSSIHTIPKASDPDDDDDDDDGVDPEQEAYERARQQDDKEVLNYVNEQLARMKTYGAAFHDEDELITQAV